MLEVEQFEKENPNLETIETMGSDQNSITITRDPSNGHFYAKGPFGNKKEIFYIPLGSDLASESKQALLSEWRRRNQ